MITKEKCELAAQLCHADRGHGLPGCEPEQWEEAMSLATQVLRIFPLMRSALLAVQRSDRLGASAAERQEARDLWTRALAAAREVGP